jgi:hypothetical protein
VAPARTSVHQYPRLLFRAMVASLLPHGYPSTVAPSYAPYASWTAAGLTFSSIAGVLSTQSLLYAIGVGAGSIPLAAALNWVLKDGLGQLGGVLYAALINNRFDADPKKWRFLSALAQDASTLLEVLCPLMPALFLPLAAIANVGKNVSWLSASATRAGIHQVLSLRGNLADVTGKAGSQSIAASTAGTILGVTLSPLIGSDPTHILIAFAICSLCHLTCIFKGLRIIVLPTLNEQRLRIATANYLALSGGDAAGLQTPERSNTCSDRTSLVSEVDQQARHSFVAILSPVEVAKVERFVPWYGMHLFPHGSEDVPVFDVPIAVGTPLEKLESFPRYLAASHTETSNYVLSVTRQDAHPTIHAVFTHGAHWRDVITGFLHAFFVAKHLCVRCKMDLTTSVTDDVEAVKRGYEFVRLYGDRCVDDLERSGWWVGQPLLELDINYRITIDTASRGTVGA